MDSFTKKRISAILEAYIDLKVPGDLRAEVRLTYRFNKRTVILSEERPDWLQRKWDSTELVHFCLKENGWCVYARQSGNEWTLLSSIPPSKDFEDVLEQVEMDTQEVIWVT